jgi:hypothetical protein
MSTADYLKSVLERGSMLRAMNPPGPAVLAGLGEVVTASQFMGSRDELVDLAGSFQIVVNPPPSGLSAADRQAVLVADLNNWMVRAQTVVVQAETDAGIPVDGSSATERITASSRVENSIRGSIGVIRQAAGAVLPDTLAPKVARRDFALMLRRQYNSVEAGILSHTPDGVGLLLSSGVSEEDIQVDYLHRIATCQAIVKLGQQQLGAVNGLGFLFLMGPLLALVAIAVVAIIATAIVGTTYITQRNQIWSDVMKQCASQQQTSEFCKSSLEAFKEEPPWTLGSVLTSNLLLIGGLSLVGLVIFKKRSSSA